MAEEYVNRNAFIAHERAWYCKNCIRRTNSKGKIAYEIGGVPCRACNIEDVLDALEDYPAANVRHVVLCRDCMHYDMGVCLKIYDDGAASKDAWQERRPTDFCSYGEKREES